VNEPPPVERDADGWGICGLRFRSLGPKFYCTTDPTICQEKNAKKIKKIIFTKRLTNATIHVIMLVQQVKERTTMTHLEFIKSNFKVIAEIGNSIFFDADGELIAEINGHTFDCDSVEEFQELVEMFGNETFEV
jgi:hypothetical protein